MTTREMIEEELDAQKPLHVCQGCWEQMLPPEHGICLDCMAKLRRARFVKPGIDAATCIGAVIGFGFALVVAEWPAIHAFLGRL